MVNKKNKKVSKKLRSIKAFNEGVKRFESMATNKLSDCKGFAHIAEKGAKVLMQYSSANNDKEREKLFDELCTQIAKYRSAASLDTNFLLKRSIDEGFTSMAFNMIENLRSKYCVKTDDDKALVQLAVMSFCRYQSNMIDFEALKKSNNIALRDRVAYMQMLSKDADKAFRQFETALQHLSFKNRMPIQINFKAKTAYFGKNQQNISNITQQNENIE